MSSGRYPYFREPRMPPRPHHGHYTHDEVRALIRHDDFTRSWHIPDSHHITCNQDQNWEYLEKLSEIKRAADAKVWEELCYSVTYAWRNV